LRSPWVAVDLAADHVAQARLLRRAHDVVLNGCGTPPVLRELVVASWTRCRAAGVDPDRPAPVMLDADETAERFAAHPLALVTPLVRGLLGTVSAEARHLIAIGNADGMLLWSEGHPRMLEAAAGPHFTPGALCSEAAVGTNAVGTALALRHPVQIFSAEHFNRLLHGWTCAAAPVFDPVSGATVGVIDLSGSFRHAHPHTLTLVTAIAQAVAARLASERTRREAELVERYVDRLSAAGRRPSALLAADGRVLAASPRRWLGERADLREENGRAVLDDGTRAALEPLADGARIVWGVRARERRVPRRALTIRALGAETPALQLGGVRLSVTARQAELLVVLAMNPAGLSAEALARSLYGPRAKAVSARAEVARVRRVVGEIVGAHPYRLAADVRADFLELEELLARRRINAALEKYAGPLLPRSRAPAIVARRADLDAALQDAVGDAGDAALRRRWERRARSDCNPVQRAPDSRRAARALEC
jgi:GAF domain